MKRRSDRSSEKSELSSDQYKRKRQSRWSANELERCVIPGMPTMLPSHMNPNDVEVYVIQVELTDVTNKLKKQNYTAEIEAMTRLPSPDPIYGNDGKRINTKEHRARERLEERRRQLVMKLQKLRPELVPSSERISVRIEEKVFIPQEDYPDINFAGLIIGPRGMTQKELEKETNTRIILRGKGSAKLGKISSVPQPGDDEQLHALIIGFLRDEVDNAVTKINKIIQEGIEFPELENGLRKNQMKQLAILNGTYRETEGLNKLKMLSEAQTIVTNTIICSLCGGVGHLPRDCKANYDPAISQVVVNHQIAQLDGEYSSFINELGPDAQHTINPIYLGFIPQQPSTESAEINPFVRKFFFRN